MKLYKSELIANKTIKICGSKSITNRMLILHALFQHIKIENISDSRDTLLLQKALDYDHEINDVEHAGTAMRFLTAYFAVQKEKNTRILTGSERMLQRPIAPLVDALRSLGANITYLKNEGFPPLKIESGGIDKNFVKIPAHISSQFITALLLVGAALPNGLTVQLEGKITSKPYIDMTVKTLKSAGIKVDFVGSIIKILPRDFNEKHSSIIHFEVESDWSSASYFYAMAAIGKKIINLKNFESNSMQGDAVLKEIYWNNFGINTIFDAQEHLISLIPEPYKRPENIILNLNNSPDIAQTIAVTSAALKIPFEIHGLETLKIKETDRLAALQKELYKIGCTTQISDDSIISLDFFEPQDEIMIETYHDHRMAMSFAPYALLHTITIQNHEVVEKSYPNFWNDFFQIVKSQ